MRKAAIVLSGTILVLGCAGLGFALAAAAILPNVFYVYLTVNPVSFSHEILYPNMTGPYVFSALEIIAGIAGVLFFGRDSGQ